MNWLVRLLTFALFLCIAGAVGLTLVFERASRYPVELQFLTPWLERNAANQLDGGQVQIEKTRFSLQPGLGGARLLLTNVTASGGMVGTPLNVGEIAVAVSLPHALLGQAKLTKITIDDLRFAARRESDGTFGFSIAPRTANANLTEIRDIPGLGPVAEATAPSNTAKAESASSSAEPLQPLDQLRSLLKDKSGIFSQFEELRLTGGSILFDDAKVDERARIHDATVIFTASNNEATVEVEGLFEIGSSISDGQIRLSTPLEGSGLAFNSQVSDIVFADLAAYLPKELLATERQTPVDVSFEARLKDDGSPRSFSMRRFKLGALRDGGSTFASPIPTLVTTGELRTGGAEGWRFRIEADEETFSSEPILRETFKDIMTFDGLVSGVVDLELAKDGRLLSLDFDTNLGAGQANIPALYKKPLPLSGAQLVGSYSPEALTFDRFQLAPIIDGRALPATLLDLEIQTPTPQERRIKMGFSNAWQLSSSDILTLWPDSNEDEGRKWFRTNVRGGRTSGQSLQLDMNTAGNRTTLNNLQADISFDQGALQVTSGLGYTKGAAGRVVVDNGLFDIDLRAGQLGPASLSNSRVKLDLREARNGRMDLSGLMTGPIRETLTYLTGANVGLDELGRSLPIGKTQGTMSVDGRMSLSLAQPPRFAPDYDLSLSLTDLRVNDYLAGLPILASTLPVRITPERIAAGGSLQLGKIQTQTTMDLRFALGKLDGLTIAATYEGQIADAEPLLGPLPSYMEGQVSGDLTFLQDSSGQQNLAVTTNLGRASIDLSPLPYFKPVGQPAQAEARLILKDNQLSKIESFKVDGPALHLLGELSMKSNGKEFDSLNLSNVVVGDSNLSRVSLLNETEFLQINIQDGQLDGRPFIESILENQGKQDASIVADVVAGADQSNALTDKPWLLNIGGIRRFVVPGGKAFTDINLRATIDDGAVLQFNISAQSPAHLPGRPSELGNLRASLTPQANGFYRLVFQSDDAGSLFSTLDLTDEIRGGVIQVSADSALPLPKGGWLGSMELRNFSIVDAPIMVQMLSLASLTGILELATGSGLQFTTLKSNFTYGNSALYLDDLRMAGPSLALTTEGSIDFDNKVFALQGNVTPFNIVSEIAGSIPVLGQVLTGTDGGGLFSAGYRINGPFAAPRVNVNAFQILTPGIYRQWFQDILNN